jgi:hypothetical protein
MVHSVCSNRMSPHQLSLLEHALHLVSNIDPSIWDEIPIDLHPAFSKYMPADVWTGRPDWRTLRAAGLQIIRDAIARTGEFSEETPAAMGVGHEE